jgi:hypothetical protein
MYVHRSSNNASRATSWNGRGKVFRKQDMGQESQIGDNAVLAYVFDVIAVKVLRQPGDRSR